MTKILLVEDDKSLREIYGVRLLAEGYDIVSAGDGEEALAMAIKERPQLIVSDVMMPKISGFDMLDILRSTTETKDIKVIMMTALSSEDQRARGEALGADRYLVKSQVGIEDVVRTVHEVLGDAPVAMPSPIQAFGGPAASSVSSRPVSSTAIPTRPATAQTPPPARPQPLPQSGDPNPVSPQPVSLPPQAPAITASPQPTPQPPAPSGLPQPTAPFSTTRPANLGDRVIHPLTAPSTGAPDINSLMAQELSGSSAAAPAQPAPQSPQPQPVAPPPSPVPDAQPFGAISFEETPRTSSPPNPAGSPPYGPQPPQAQ